VPRPAGPAGRRGPFGVEDRGCQPPLDLVGLGPHLHPLERVVVHRDAQAGLLQHPGDDLEVSAAEVQHPGGDLADRPDQGGEARHEPAPHRGLELVERLVGFGRGSGEIIDRAVESALKTEAP